MQTNGNFFFWVTKNDNAQVEGVVDCQVEKQD
jgi:hypothetical protein